MSRIKLSLRSEGTNTLTNPFARHALGVVLLQEGLMDSIIYLVGLVVVIMAILSLLGLR